MSNQAQLATSTSTQSAPTAWRSVGVWMTVILIVYVLFNSVRAVLSPTDFASYFGTPLTSPTNDAFVFVYAIRTLFLGVFALALLLTRNFATLSLYILVAVLMPIGDAVVVASRGAPIEIIVRHGLTAGFLLLTWFFLQRWLRSVASK